MYNNLIIKSKISGTYTVDFINELSQQLRQTINDKSIFIIDKTVIELFKEELIILEANSRLIIIESSEKNKTIDYCQIIIRNLIELDVRKDDKLIAIGGGITQDIVAFISSIFIFCTTSIILLLYETILALK